MHLTFAYPFLLCDFCCVTIDRWRCPRDDSRWPRSCASYRLAFETSIGTLVTSTNIATYNTFVSNVANSQPELAALGTTWTAIGSTSTINAQDNTLTNPNNSDPSYQIYNLGGNLVAASNSALWGTSPNGLLNPLSNPIEYTQTGAIFFGNPNVIWTGTQATGVPGPAPLGGTIVYLGDSSATSSSWVDKDFNLPTLGSFPMYALSGVLTVPTPEPSTMILACFAAAGLAATALCRQRHFAR